MDPKTGDLAVPEAEIKPEFQEEKPVEKIVAPRDKAIAEMARRAEIRRQEELGAFKPDSMDDEGVITSAEIEEPQIEETQSEQAEQQIPEETRELIVNGQRMTVPLSKVIEEGVRTLQKETSADLKLKAASELERQWHERLAQPSKPDVQQPVQQPSITDAEIARKIQFGTEAEAAEAISTLKGSGKASSPQEIVGFVQQQMNQMIPEHIAFHDATNWLRTEHKEITSDPDLKSYFDMQEVKARQSGDKRPYRELYDDLAKQMVTKFNLRTQDKQEPAQPMDRISRKINSPRPVQGAAGKVVQQTQEKKAFTVADYVTQQRQRRGLQQ